MLGMLIKILLLLFIARLVLRGLRGLGAGGMQQRRSGRDPGPEPGEFSVEEEPRSPEGS